VRPKGIHLVELTLYLRQARKKLIFVGSYDKLVPTAAGSFTTESIS
jgi:hypothetical protein